MGEAEWLVSGHHVYALTKDERGREVNRFCATFQAAGPHGATDDELRAHAQLAHAAPDLRDLAKAYEQWEAALILCEEAWRGGAAALPTLTWELWDRLLDIQKRRNAVVAKATGKEATR